MHLGGCGHPVLFWPPGAARDGGDKGQPSSCLEAGMGVGSPLSTCPQLAAAASAWGTWAQCSGGLAVRRGLGRGERGRREAVRRIPASRSSGWREAGAPGARGVGGVGVQDTRFGTSIPEVSPGPGDPRRPQDFRGESPQLAGPPAHIHT